ncbi:syncytin-1-like [Colossoma macropomum]|uniref:syncytin-1-like n=1 Tax=Colossoma macropomum TaxID=42526 RepID=UPI00186548B5|nr:syncytin-1-like [Colossoma macropomum]XP_036420124.1 syncytin-1-like [Colossoma macropomum]
MVVCHALHHRYYVIPMSNISAQALCTDHSASESMRIIAQMMVDGISEDNWPLPIVRCLRSNRAACYNPNADSSRIVGWQYTVGVDSTNYNIMVYPNLTIAHDYWDTSSWNYGVADPIPVRASSGWVCIDKHYPDTYLGNSTCSVSISAFSMNGTFWCKHSTTTNTNPCGIWMREPLPLGFYWVCGNKAYQSLPSDSWCGSCYMAVVIPPITVHTDPWTTLQSHGLLLRMKRELGITLTGKQTWNGHIIKDPWSSIAQTVGWGIFLFGGVVDALQKINYLVYSTQKLANETSEALRLVNDELHALREVVLENKKVLDLLTLEKGGLCHILNTSCCIYVPDNYENIDKYVTDLHRLIPNPEGSLDKFFNWVGNIFGGIFSGILQQLLRYVLPFVAPVIVAIVIYFCLKLLWCLMTKLHRRRRSL